MSETFNRNIAPATGQPVVYAYPGYDTSVDAELDLRELAHAVWQGRWVIFLATLVFAIVTVAYSLSLPNIYKAEAVLAPSEESQGGGLAKMAGQLGGLASLAGISLGASEGGNKVAIALEVIKSRKFITDFIGKHSILPELMAVEDWNPISSELVYDQDLYDPERDIWVRKVKPPKESRPSSWEAYKEFINILTVSRDAENGFVTVGIEHPSPYLAKRWTELLVKELNATMKEADVEEARRSIEYLNNQLNQVALAEMRTVFYELIEDQIQTMMLADVRDEYVFSTIDPPVVPEEKAGPARVLICFLGAFVGGILITILVLLHHFLRRDNG